MEVEQRQATSEECLQSTSLNGPQPTQPTQTDPQEKDSNSNSSSSNLVVGVQSSSSSSREVGRRQKSGSWRDTSRKGSPGSTPSRYPQSGTQFLFFLKISCNAFPSQARAKERVLRNTEVGRGLVTKMGQEASTPEMDKYNLHVEEVNFVVAVVAPVFISKATPLFLLLLS